MVAKPRSIRVIHWHLRSQSPRIAGSRLVVALLPEDPHSPGIHLVQMLLEYTEPARGALWPFEQRVLVIDGDPTYRRFIVGMLDAAGAGCYGAASADHALHLLQEDEDIGFVILDHDQASIDLAALVRSLRRIRPDVTIIGSSEDDCRAGFAAIGVDVCLIKPWRLQDLTQRLM